MIGPITGVLASRSGGYEYFTTVLYPFVVDDSLSVNNLIISAGVIWENPNDYIDIGQFAVLSGTLDETIVYKVYNEPLAVDGMSIGQFAVLSGTLDETIVYQVYDNWPAEEINIPPLSIISGTLS